MGENQNGEKRETKTRERKGRNINRLLKDKKKETGRVKAECKKKEKKGERKDETLRQ